jgi:UDP-glucose 4-epimerase
VLIAVTGTTGFIGRRIVSALVARGHVVRALVRAGSQSKVSPELETAIWDLEHGGDPAVLAGADALVHAGAYKPRSQTDSSEAAIAAGVPHFAYLSAGNAYRPLQREAVEEDALYPSLRATYYLTSKLCGEIYADHAHQTGRTKVCVLRPSGVYGPGMSEIGLVPILADRLRRGEKATVHDGGRYRVDLVYVDDVAEATCAAVERVATGMFNVGSGSATSSLELATLLAGLTGRGRAFVEVTEGLDGPPSVGFSALDIGRARRELGFAPRELSSGLAAYLGSLP